MTDDLRRALTDLIDWIDAEVAYRRPDPYPAMRMQADLARAALAARSEPRAEGPDIAYWRKQLASRNVSPDITWPDGDVMVVVRKLIEAFDAATPPAEGLDREAVVATLRRDDLCDATEGEHHTDEYIAAFLAAVAPEQPE